MPNNSPFLFFGASIFKTYLPATYLPPATYLLRVCLYHPRQQPTPKPFCHPQLPPRQCSFVTASRPATLINAHHRLTTLPPSPFRPSSARVCPSLTLFCFLVSSDSVAFPSSLMHLFALHNFSITSQMVI
jgi:hypothetical protein